jgi:hypothetical protein
MNEKDAGKRRSLGKRTANKTEKRERQLAIGNGEHQPRAAG